MNDSSLSDTELRRRRQDIRRGLARVNAAGVIIVAVVIGLAVAAGFAAFRAGRSAEDARTASLRAEEQLRKSYRAQSTAGRLSRVMGRKSAGLEAIAAAARIMPESELRDEAIAHLALVDFEEIGAKQPLLDHSVARAFAPDFDLYAGTDGQGNVRLFRTIEQTEVFAWRGTNAPVQMLLFSPNGRYLVVIYPSHLFVLDVKQHATTAHAEGFNAFDFVDEGRLIGVLRDDHAIHFLESASGGETRPALPLSETVYDITFHPTERKVAVISGTGIEIWDWETRQKLQTLDRNRPVTSMAWRGRYLALGDREGDLEILDVAAKTARRLPAHKDYISRLVFSHRADLLVSASYDGLTRVWDPQTGYLLFETAKAFPTDFSRDDTRLGMSPTRDTFGWWRVSRPKGYCTLNCADGSDGNIWQVDFRDFASDNRHLAVAKRNGVHVFDISTGERAAFRALQESRSALFLHNGTTLLTVGDNRISLWPVEETASPFVLGTPKQIGLPKKGRVDTATLSRDGRLVALPLTVTDALLLDIENPAHMVLFEKAINPKLIAISPDNRWIASGTFHGRGTWLWDAATGQKVRELDDGNAAPYFGPDGKLLLVAGNSEYRLYDTASWTITHRQSSQSPTSLPNRAAFSDDGRLLAIVKELHHVELLDPRTWEVLANLIAPEPQVITWLTFNREGTLLAAATHQDQVQLWDLAAIRRELRLFDLDWERPAAASEAGSNLTVAAAAVRRASASGSSGVVSRFLAGTTAAVGLVVFCAWVVLRRQRQLIDNYVQVDQLIERRNEELQATRTELVHSQKMKALGTLAAGIAHDFNNLLSVIRMSNKLIGREAHQNEAIRENVVEIEQAVQQGKSVVSSMLGYSREASDASGPFSLPELVEDTVALLSKQFLSGIALTLELDRHSQLVNGSRGRLEQILLNLVVNAAEAMNGNGNLTIRARQAIDLIGPWALAPLTTGNHVELAVTDSGPGIAADVLPRIFEPFFTTKNMGAEHGTGLGLSMVYSIARQDGLGIRVETEPGKGTTFTIVIPVDGATKISTT